VDAPEDVKGAASQSNHVRPSRADGPSHRFRNHFPNLIGIKTRARDHDEINQVQQAAILFPTGQLEKSIDPDQEEKAVTPMK
jgi:hypothetical protein